MNYALDIDFLQESTDLTLFSMACERFALSINEAEEDDDKNIIDPDKVANNKNAKHNRFKALILAFKEKLKKIGKQILEFIKNNYNKLKEKIQDFKLKIDIKKFNNMKPIKANVALQQVKAKESSSFNKLTNFAVKNIGNIQNASDYAARFYNSNLEGDPVKDVDNFKDKYNIVTKAEDIPFDINQDDFIEKIEFKVIDKGIFSCIESNIKVTKVLAESLKDFQNDIAKLYSIFNNNIDIIEGKAARKKNPESYVSKAIQYHNIMIQGTILSSKVCNTVISVVDKVINNNRNLALAIANKYMPNGNGNTNDSINGKTVEAESALLDTEMSFMM